MARQQLGKLSDCKKETGRLDKTKLAGLKQSSRVGLRLNKEAW